MSVEGDGVITESEVQQFEDFQDYNSSQKSSVTQDSVLDGDREYYINIDTKDKTAYGDDSTSLLSASFRIKEMLVDELKTPAKHLNCGEHPNQETNCYYLEGNKLLCPECVKSKKYNDQQVITFKRASIQIRRMVDELLYEIDTKAGFYSITEKRVEAKKEDLKEVFSSHTEQILTLMAALRNKIDDKEQDLLKEAYELKAEKLAELDAVLNKNKRQWEEANNITNTVKNTMNTLDDAEVCQYYSQKASLIKNFLTEEENKLVDDAANVLLSHRDQREQFSIKKFNDEVQFLMSQINTLPGVQEIVESSDFKDFGSRLKEIRFSSDLEARNGVKNNLLASANKEGENDLSLAKSFYVFMKNQNNSSPAKTKSTLYSEILNQFNEKPKTAAREKTRDVYSLLDNIFEQDGVSKDKEPRIVETEGLASKKNNPEELREALTNMTKKFTEGPKQRMRNEEKLREFSPDESRANSATRILSAGLNSSYEKNRLYQKSYIPSLSSSKLDLGYCLSPARVDLPRSALVPTVKMRTRQTTQKPFRESLKGTQLENVFNSRGKSVSGLEKDLSYLKASISKLMVQPTSTRASNRYSETLRMKFFN